MKRIALILLALSALSCNNFEDGHHRRSDGSPYNPVAPTPPPPAATSIEYRVLGDAANIKVRYLSSVEGTVLTQGSCPWIAKLTTADNPIYVSLEATSTNGFIEETLQGQIFINGKLFRESIVTGFGPSVSVSGTFTRP